MSNLVHVQSSGCTITMCIYRFQIEKVKYLDIVRYLSHSSCNSNKMLFHIIQCLHRMFSFKGHCYRNVFHMNVVVCVCVRICMWKIAWSFDQRKLLCWYEFNWTTYCNILSRWYVFHKNQLQMHTCRAWAFAPANDVQHAHNFHSRNMFSNSISY